MIGHGLLCKLCDNVRRVVLMLDGSLFGVDGLLSTVVVCQQYYFDVPSVMYMKKVA